MISDRLKIAKNGAAPDVMLSRQTFLNCAAFKGFGGGCDGGDVADVFGYMSKFGLPDESCLTYNGPHEIRRPESRQGVPRRGPVHQLHAGQRLRHVLGGQDADPVLFGVVREGREQELRGFC